MSDSTFRFYYTPRCRKGSVASIIGFFNKVHKLPKSSVVEAARWIVLVCSVARGRYP